MRKWLIGPLVCAGLIGVTLGVSAFAVTTNPSDARRDTFQQLDLYTTVLGQIEKNYVEEVDETKVIEASINGMLSSLDPHSSYLSPDDFHEMAEQTRGEYGGLGIEVTSEEGAVKVVTPMDDTPASRAGIKSGDFLVGVDGVSIIGMPLDDALKMLRGEAGTSLTITIAREGQEPFDVTLTRENIRPDSVRYEVKDGNIGYIRVSSFNERTSDTLDKAIDSLRKEIRGPMKGIVLDLRNNPGGLLDQAVKVSSRFIESGAIVSTKGRRPEDNNRYNAVRTKRAPDVPIVVLINNGSASAAEIVAGALKDHKRAQILGLTSFGKGSVQTLTPLGPGKGAIRLTTSRYYTPSGGSIQGAGIEPDYEVANVRLSDEDIETLKRLQIRYNEAGLRNALENDQGLQRKPPHIPANMPPEDYKGDDFQLEEALKLLETGSL
ncbi:MAG: S41 family peptidase [Hyphomonadaceae bacterium]